MAQGPEWVPHLLTFQEQGLQRNDSQETTPIYTPGPESVQMLLAQGDPPVRPNRHPRPPRPPPQHPREARRLGGRRGRMATQDHQHPRPLRRCHGTPPPSPGRGIPPGGHAHPHNHHRRHERRPHLGGPRGTGHIPGPCSPRHHRNAGAPGPDGQPRRPTIPLPLPSRCRPLPHQSMLWRPHNYHPGGGPIWAPPAGPTGQSPLHIRPTFPNLPPSPPEDADQGLPPPLRMPPLHDKQAWSQYHRAIDRARRHPTGPHRPTHSHEHGRRRLRLPAAPPH